MSFFALKGINFPAVLSINGGSELMLYGGTVASKYVSGIWKYKTDQDSWTKVGDLIHARAEHITIAVTGIECP